MKISQLILTRILTSIFSAALIFSCSAKKNLPSATPVQRVDPPFWWTGMSNDTLELTFYDINIQRHSVRLTNENTKILNITRPANKNYLFVEIVIGDNQQPGQLEFILTDEKKKEKRFLYTLKARENLNRKRGLNPDDLIYLVFPDRFANGDPSNDAYPNLNEKSVDRNGLKTRHGGDLKGIMDHLSYIEELGTTAIWINPVLENNQPRESYHGYAATDLYKIDPRFGTNELYKNLVDECHKKQIKVIWDVVYNHWGNEHHMYKDLPDSSWIHWFEKFTRTNYRAENLLDPYGSKYDKNLMTNAWFDHHMPDLNQQNKQLATYLIQNSIWWIEYAGLDAFRIDTYAYPDQRFMKNLNEAVLREYPDFMLFGETWVQGSPVQAWFTEANGLNKEFSSSLHGVTDFQLYFAITKGLMENFGWEEGFRRIELTLSHDILYKDPYRNVTFLDNHDLSRYYSMVGEDFGKFKMGMALMYTLRGIPSIYYGTEILMKNYADPDAKVREDFPGGWASDTTSKFTAAGRTALENEAFEFTKKLGNWRKENRWIGRSKLVQFVPEDNTYIYFRMDDNHKLMCVYNGNDTTKEIDLKRYVECIAPGVKVENILSGDAFEMGQTLKVGAKDFLLLEVK